MWLLLTTALAGSPAGESGEIHDFIVLAADLDKGLVAFKNVVSFGAYEEEPPECEYAGMKDPTAGVQLGLYDLNKGLATKVWNVYDVPEPGGQCTSHEESTKRLEEAKAHFAGVGLDISKPPTMIEAKDGVLDVPGGALTGKQDKAEVEADDAMMMHATVRLTRGDAVVYERSLDWNAAGAGYYGVSWPKALVQGDKILLVERTEEGNMRGSATSHSFRVVGLK